MKITCGNAGFSAEHIHDSWESFRACVGEDPYFIARVTRPVTPGVPATTTDAREGRSEPLTVHVDAAAPSRPIRDPGAKPTGRQLWRINRDGGSWRDAYMGTKAEASAIIGQLSNPLTAPAWKLPRTDDLNDDDWEIFPQERAYRRGELEEEWESFDVDTGELSGNGFVAAPTPPARTPVYDEAPPKKAGEVYAVPSAPREEVREAREHVKTMLPLLKHVKDGYYAARIDSGLHNDLKFFRLSRPTKGEYKDCVKLQWQLADRWEICWILRPSGWMTWPVRTFDVPAYILAIMADPTGGTRLYAKMIDKCCRCNTTLTDERSRHYGIGPECEKYRPDIIAAVDLEDAIERERADAAWK